MSIDPEFDVFRERMPLNRRFYMDVCTVFNERASDVVNVIQQEHDIDVTDKFGLIPLDENILIQSSILQADTVGYQTLYSSQKAEALFGREPTPAMIVDLFLFNDGSPWAAEQDLAFMDAAATNEYPMDDLSVHRYIVIVNPEQPPLAVSANISDWADRQLEKQRTSGQSKAVIHVTDTLQYLQNAGYQPHILSDQDCASILESLRCAPLEANAILEYVHVPTIDGELIPDIDKD